MSRRFRPRLSYANVASTLALVIALGGVSYAAVKINGANLKARSVAASKIKKNTLTGTEIKESKLGKVPKAKAADTAGDSALLGGATPQSYRLGCPADTTLVLGECFETTLRPAAFLRDALKACADDQRRVPTFGELEALRQKGMAVGVQPNEYELSATLFHEAAGDELLAIDPVGNRFAGPYLSYSKQYRCVGLPANAG